jgi:WD40 repeat protein
MCFTHYSVNAQFYRGAYQEYGKNRVQYNGFSWKFHNYKRFKIYYSGANEDLAIYTARTLHLYLSAAEGKLDYIFPEKMDIIVYQSQSKFRQSNLGITDNENTEIAGGSQIVGSKIFVYYSGNHQDFNKIIKGAVYEVLIKHIFYGGNWKNQIKSNLNSSLPSWLEKGLINYLVEDWNPYIDSRVKDLVLTNRVNRFNNLNDEEKIIVGQAIWYFIAENYGLTSIPNLLGLTRITGNFERALYVTIGQDYISLSKNYINYFKARYVNEYDYQKEPSGEQINFKHKKETVYYSVKINADGSKIAYIENTLGRYRIKIYDKDTKKTTKVYAAEPKIERIQDYSYPIIEWHPSGDALAFYAEVKGEVMFFIYTLNDKSLNKKAVKGYDKILSFDYSPDGKRIVISAVVKGQTDLYIYNVSGGGKQQLTNDIFDDLTPRFKDNYHVVFASNRLSDTIYPITPEINFIPTKNDIFVYNLKEAKHTFKYLTRITDTPLDNETQPFPFKENYVFLSDHNGLYNQFISHKDSSIAYIDTITHYSYSITPIPLTNYVTSINEHSVNKQLNSVYLIYQNHQYKIFEKTQQELLNGDISAFRNATYKQTKEDKKSFKERLKQQTKKDTSYINNVNYQKLIVKIGEDNQKINGDSTIKDSTLIKDKFKKPKYSIYKINFAKNYLLTQLDNNFLFQNYQVYKGPGTVYFNAGMNALLKIGASDLFDDYKLMGGMRIPTSFGNGGEQLLKIENLKNRFDHRLIYYRQKIVDRGNFFTTTTQDLRYRLSFPFNEVLALRMTTNLRQDMQVFIPYSDATLIKPIAYNHTTGLKFELVFDNSIPMDLNIRRGSRMKIFSEFLFGIENQSSTLNLGLDLRQYTRITRNFIWVNRLAGATSLGTKKLLYYMGAVDNWIFTPEFNYDIDVDPSQNYGFQTTATPMRGFTQNIRNGNSFILLNSELRIPIFTFFSSYPIKYDMIKHFQLVAFADVGTAWTGPHPLSSDNYFNTQIINDKPVTINVENLREPFIGAVGFGARSKIWGYFVKADFGWGIENFELQKPRLILSLGLDI